MKAKKQSTKQTTTKKCPCFGQDNEWCPCNGDGDTHIHPQIVGHCVVCGGQLDTVTVAEFRTKGGRLDTR